jgi:NAD(P)-dependent dehydrogenase (short-subunit alcohol dehydrogenase family)
MNKKAVLISGASSGIGAATARLFAQQGYFVFLMGRNEERLQAVALECRAGASILKTDITDPAGMKKYLSHLRERPDVDLEVLVNNAGIFEMHAFEDQGLEIWRKQFEVNLFGTVALTQGLLPIFKAKKKGSIVNVSSGLGLRPQAKMSAYSSTKAAMIAMTQALAHEVGADGIRVNCVAPGLVDTPIHSFHSKPAEEREKTLQKMGPLQPLGRIGKPEEIAEAIYFLGSDHSSWTTGAVLTVDGGINLT